MEQWGEKRGDQEKWGREVDRIQTECEEKDKQEGEEAESFCKQI